LISLTALAFVHRSQGGRGALARARAEDLRVLADYVREVFKLFNEKFEGIDKRLSSFTLQSPNSVDGSFKGTMLGGLRG
jgi:predicted nucleotidyltransferase